MTSLIEIPQIEHLDEECPVCLEVPSAEFTATNNGFKTLSKCGHKVCCRCVKAIVLTNYNAQGLKCPLCRVVDTTFINVRDRITRERRIAARMSRSNIPNIGQRPDRQIDYERILHQSAARTMNRTRVINGPLAPRSAIPQQVPIFCLRCETPGCQTKNRTKRRCPNHSQVPCCTKCYECNECIRI